MEVGLELAKKISKFLKENSQIFNPDMSYNVLYQFQYDQGTYLLNVIQVIDPVPFNYEKWESDEEFIDYLSKETNDSLQNLHIDFLKSLIQ